MRIKTILPFVVALAISIWSSAHAGEQPKAANAGAETSAEAKAKADFDAAENAAKNAEATIAPLKVAMQKADAAYANARNAANAKRQQATDAKDLAGEPGVRELKQAEANLPAAVKALADATNAKPARDKALAEAKAAAIPLQQAYDAAEKAAKEAEAAAKVAADAANKLDDEAKRAAAQATAKRRAADAAKAVLTRAQQNEQRTTAQANSAVQKLAEAELQKKAADAALAGAKNQPQAALQNLQKQANAAAQKLARATAQKKLADAALVNAKNQVAAATTASAATETAAQDFAKVAEGKKLAADQAVAKRKAGVDKELIQIDTASKQAAADAAAKRKAADAAKVALAPVQQKLEQAAIQANAAAQELARDETRKKSAEEGLVNLKQRVAAAIQTHLADEQAAKDAEAVATPLELEANKTRAAYAAAVKTADDKRGLAEQAKAALYRLVAARQVANLMESSDPPVPANRIDEIVFARLKALGIKPILCSDAVFVRRAYLDTTGRLPSAEEAKAFIRSSDKNKRVALIDRLLDQSAHFDYWAMKWSDILRVRAEFPVKVWPNAAQAYRRWVWESIAQNKRYDQLARELLTSSGSNFRVGPVNFYRAIQDKTPEGITAVVGLTLMGTRVHLWPADRRAGMAVFFSQVGYKPTGEWKEEIIFWDPLHSVAMPGNTAPGIDSVAKSVTATNQIPQALAQPLSGNGPLAAVFPDGAKTTIPPDRDPREVFADWLIRPENPWFAKNVVNRTWAWVMGRGIIHEPDDIRDDNPPSNPELMAYLQKELVSSGYDLKHLKRLLFTSTTYQLSSIPRFQTPEGRANFASYPLRRVEAEVLIDALNDITGSSDLYTSAVPEPFTYIPNDMSAVALADGSITSSFLALFGRSARATGMESERVNELASTQWLHMLNSTTIQSKLQSGPKLAAMLSSGGKPNEIAERLYLTILSRFPTDAEVKAVEEYTKTGVAKGRDVWIDLAWALINSPEFLLRH